MRPNLWGVIHGVRVFTKHLIAQDEGHIVKRPGGAPFPWHQEAPYWAYGAQQLAKIVNVLTYLDDGTKENGCIWVILGSHKQGTLQGLENRGVLGSLYTDVELARR